MNSRVSEKAGQTEVDVLTNKIDDLENYAKRNNVVIWGVEEGSERDFTEWKNSSMPLYFKAISRGRGGGH